MIEKKLSFMNEVSAQASYKKKKKKKKHDLALLCMLIHINIYEVGVQQCQQSPQPK